MQDAEVRSPTRSASLEEGKDDRDVGLTGRPDVCGSSTQLTMPVSSGDRMSSHLVPAAFPFSETLLNRAVQASGQDFDERVLSKVRERIERSHSIYARLMETGEVQSPFAGSKMGIGGSGAVRAQIASHPAPDYQFLLTVSGLIRIYNELLMAQEAP